MNYGLAWFDKNFETLIISALLVAIAVLSAIQVVMRYCFSALPWVEEVVVYLHVWLGFIGLGYAVSRDNNLRIDIATFLPEKLGGWIKQIADFITFCAYLYLGYCGIGVLEHSARIGQVSPAAGVPITYLYLALMVGACLGCFRYLQRMYRLCIKPGGE